MKRARTPLSERRLAHRLLAEAELRDVRLYSCVARHDLSSNAPLKKVEVSIEAHSTVVLSDTPRVLVSAKFMIKGRPKESKESLHLEFVFQLRYQFASAHPDTENEKAVNAFTKWIGLNNAWPYAREFVQQMTGRMGLSQLKLPLYKPEEHDIQIVEESVSLPRKVIKAAPKKRGR